MGLRWISDISIGIDEIDFQHKELFKVINSLLLKIKRKRKKKEIKKLLQTLQENINNHFKAEENLMKSYGYPKYEMHRNEHWEFIKDFILITNQFDLEGETSFLIILLRRKVGKWLVHHINKSDKEFGSFVQKYCSIKRIETIASGKEEKNR